MNKVIHNRFFLASAALVTVLILNSLKHDDFAALFAKPSKTALTDTIVTPNSVDLSADMISVSINNLGLLEPARFYRVILDVQKISTETSADGIVEDETINIYLRSDSSKSRQLVKSLDLRGHPSRMHYKEILFQSEGKYSGLEFERLSEMDKNDYIFRVLHVSELPQNLESLAEIPSAFIGTTQPFGEQADLRPIPSEECMRITTELRGALFTAEESRLDYVSFQLDLARSSNEVYVLEIREVRDNGQLSPIVTQSLTFDRVSAHKKYKDIMQGDDIFTFPVSANLKRESVYAIGFRAESFFGSLLHPAYIGYSTSNGTGNHFKSSNAKLSKNKNVNIGMTVYSSDFAELDGYRIPTGAVIVNNGDGSGTYVYETKQSYTDYLDIHKFEQPDLTEASLYAGISYDGASISGVANSGNSYIYEFYTKYPIKNVHLEATQINMTTELSYSLDGKDWTKINNLSLQRMPYKFKEDIKMKSPANRFFIRVGYDNRLEQDNIDKGELTRFGLKKLRVNATLDTK